MIISCEKCNKKFELSDELIPDKGRLLQCGSCSYQWHYVPNETIKLVKEIETADISNNVKKTSRKQTEKKVKKDAISEKKGIGFLSIIVVLVISFIALLIIVDTFKIYIVSFIPNIDFYLSSLYESLKDIFLFFKDLIK